MLLDQTKQKKLVELSKEVAELEAQQATLRNSLNKLASEKSHQFISDGLFKFLIGALIALVLFGLSYRLYKTLYLDSLITVPLGEIKKDFNFINLNEVDLDMLIESLNISVRVVKGIRYISYTDTMVLLKKLLEITDQARKKCLIDILELISNGQGMGSITTFQLAELQLKYNLSTTLVDKLAELII